MNNAFAIKDTLDEAPERDISPLLRKRAQELTDIVEALQNIASSSHWKVLQKYEFDDTLSSLLVELGNETDTVRIYRLQGEIKRAKKFILEKLLVDRRVELERIRKQLNGNPECGSSKCADARNRKERGNYLVLHDSIS